MDPIDRFLAIAAKHPQLPAIHTDETEWSYAQLERATRAVARSVVDGGSTRIAIALHKAPATYATILGVGLAGGYYAPLNVSSPLDKLQSIVTQLEPDLIISDGDLLTSLSAAWPAAKTLRPCEVADDELLEGAGTRHDISHIIFTSGSTGQPKGVIIPRSAMAHFVEWQESFGIGPGDRVSQQPNLAFDMSLTDICGAFCFGGTLYPLVTDGDNFMPGDFIRRHRITVWGSVPSVLSQIQRGNQLTPENLDSIRLITTAGEPLFKEHLDAVFAANPRILFQNSYGPTETTITMTSRMLTSDDYLKYCRNCVAFGGPIEGMDIVLIDGAHPDEGEALIIGPQVADGYWRDPIKTAAAFVDHNGRKAYRSGDWVERIDGEYYFKERIDFQVKIRGFRVELGEVAAALRRLGFSVAVAFKHGESLAAVVERRTGVAFNEREIKLKLQAMIEKHAIPTRIVEVDALPRSANDKLDRKLAMQLFESLV